MHRKLRRRRQCLLTVTPALFVLATSWSARATDLTVRVTTADHAPLAGAVLALYPSAQIPPPAAREWIMDQVDKRFVPTLLAIHRGDTVSFPNSDDIRHHVYSFSPAHTFELPLYHGIPADPVRFEQAGKVVLGCNIHDRMAAHIYVLDTPLFAIAAEGEHAFVGLPPGNYELALFHPELPAAEDGRRSNVTVQASGAQRVTLVAAPAEPPAAVAGELSPLERKFRELRRAPR
ncbi:MAG: methylamine utilization protein [Gammaproteobacteria bacterium]